MAELNTSIPSTVMIARQLPPQFLPQGITLPTRPRTVTADSMLVTPVAMGKATRGIEIKVLDEVVESQVVLWMKQITTAPGVGGKRQKA